MLINISIVHCLLTIYLLRETDAPLTPTGGGQGAFCPSALTIRPKEFTDNLSRYIATIGRLGVDFKPKQHMVMHLGSRHYDWTPLNNEQTHLHNKHPLTLNP